LNSRVPRALALAVLGVTAPITLVACGGGGGHAASARIHCGLIASGQHDGKAVVTYDDTTGVPKMSAAIQAAVTDWNSSGAPVVLKPATQDPSLTFAAASDQPPLPACKNASPRRVVVTWNTAFWSAGGGKQEVRYPTGDAEHAIGHALGLIPGGHCPELMSLKPCADRATAPNAAQMKVLDTLYSSAPPRGGSSPTP
jgi:hypothetical protein